MNFFVTMNLALKAVTILHFLFHVTFHFFFGVRETLEHFKLNNK